MSDRRKGKGKAIYNNEPGPPQPHQQQPQPTQAPQQQPPPPQQQQPQGQLQQQQSTVPQQVTIQHTQTVTIQPRVIYGKQMPVSVPTQQIQPDQNVRIIYTQQTPMQVQMQVPGDPNVRTTYVLSNQHIGLNPLQVQDGTMINRAEQVVCEVDLRQYQQMQQQAAAAHQVVQQQQQPQHSEDHLRTAMQVMTSQYQQTNELPPPPHVVDQSQQTHTPIQLNLPTKKKEKVLLPCMHCKDSFRTECQLQAHIRNKHIKPYKCDNCWKAFSFESQLKLHVTTHTGEKPYKCDVCPKAYARKTALFNHVRVHARKKFFKCCKYCGKGFKNEEKLEKHERMHSMSDERKYVSLEMYVENK